MKSESKKLGRRAFVARLGAGGAALVAANLTGGCAHGERAGEILENEHLRLGFDGETGLLASIQNKLTDESLRVQSDDFAIVAREFSLSPKNMRLQSLRKRSPEVVEANYGAEGRQVITTYRLRRSNHFIEKQLTITSPSAFSLNSLVVSKLGFSNAALNMMTKYVYLKNTTYFGRSNQGGIFLGMELPFDGSSLDDDGRVSLGYWPSLKVKARESLESEPAYLGVYKRRAQEKKKADLPLLSESEAMVAMTSKIMGPPRHGLAPMACGWWCEMQHKTFSTRC